MMFRLDEKVAVVTGGNRGIGLAIARALADAGAHVVLAARDAAKLQEAVADIQAAGGSASFDAVDLQQPATCRALIDRVVEQYGQIDILVNNAGINVRKPALELDIEEYHRVLAINLHAVYALCQAAGQHMRAAGRGKIINIGSITSTYGLGNVSAYAVSKGGVLQLTRAFATELGRYNIQVNAIIPGFIRTELNHHLWEKPDVLNWALGNTPAGRLGTADDVAGAAVFLAAPASDFVTGSTVTVDGGFLAGGPWPID
jgi:2-dehydro-3-deoxy-D-gluconate 5-dehydrogenase